MRVLLFSLLVLRLPWVVTWWVVWGLPRWVFRQVRRMVWDRFADIWWLRKPTKALLCLGCVFLGVWAAETGRGGAWLEEAGISRHWDFLAYSLGIPVLGCWGFAMARLQGSLRRTVVDALLLSVVPVGAAGMVAGAAAMWVWDFPVLDLGTWAWLDSCFFDQRNPCSYDFLWRLRAIYGLVVAGVVASVLLSLQGEASSLRLRRIAGWPFRQVLRFGPAGGIFVGCVALGVLGTWGGDLALFRHEAETFVREHARRLLGVELPREILGGEGGAAGRTVVPLWGWAVLAVPLLGLGTWGVGGVALAGLHGFAWSRGALWRLAVHLGIRDAGVDERMDERRGVGEDSARGQIEERERRHAEEAKLVMGAVESTLLAGEEEDAGDDFEDGSMGFMGEEGGSTGRLDPAVEAEERAKSRRVREFMELDAQQEDERALQEALEDQKVTEEFDEEFGEGLPLPEEYEEEGGRLVDDEGEPLGEFDEEEGAPEEASGASDGFEDERPVAEKREEMEVGDERAGPDRGDWSSDIPGDEDEEEREAPVRKGPGGGRSGGVGRSGVWLLREYEDRGGVFKEPEEAKEEGVRRTSSRDLRAGASVVSKLHEREAVPEVGAAEVVEGAAVDAEAASDAGAAEVVEGAADKVEAASEAGAAEVVEGAADKVEAASDAGAAEVVEGTAPDVAVASEAGAAEVVEGAAVDAKAAPDVGAAEQDGEGAADKVEAASEAGAAEVVEGAAVDAVGAGEGFQEEGVQRALALLEGREGASFGSGEDLTSEALAAEAGCSLEEARQAKRVMDMLKEDL